MNRAKYLLLLLAVFLPGIALAQAYPSKSIRLLVPFAPGGTPEQFAETIKADTVRWAKVVSDAGIRIDRFVVHREGRFQDSQKDPPKIIQYYMKG